MTMLAHLRRPCWQTIIVVGLLGAALDTWGLSGATQDFAYDVIGLAAVSVMVAAALRRPEGRKGWLTVAAGLGCWTLGDGLWTWYDAVLHRTAPYPGPPDALYLVGYPLAATGLLMLSRKTRRPDRAHSMGDAAIVSIGVAVIIWQVLLDPAIDNPAVALGAKVTASAYPAMDLLMLLLVLRVVFSGSVRAVPIALLGAATGLTFICDVALAGVKLAGSSTTSLNIGWLMGYVLAAAAACHPDASEDARASEVLSRIGSSTRGRFVLLAVSGVSAPIVVILLTLLHRPVDVALLCATSAVLLALILYRLAVLVRELEASNAAQRRLSLQLEHRASRDPLTQTVNRTEFTRLVDSALQSRAGTDVAIAYIDLDTFKSVNDGAGHAIGDELLIAVADRLRHVTRATDVVCRLGGDEFAVLFTSHETQDLDHIGGRFVDAFGRTFRTTRGPLHAHASIGLARGVAGEGSNELLARSDAAMYTAKELGKNRYVVFDEAMADRMVDRLQLQETVERAIQQNRLEVHYQPIVDTASTRWLGVEALVRCRTETGALLAPGDFLAIAEDAGLLETIDRTVLETAIADLSAWRQLPGAADMTVSVNASARALLAPDYQDFVDAQLSRHGLPGCALTIELTEDVHVADSALVATVLRNLRARGISIALDDFGTGYSCLAYIADLPLDIIKVPIHFTGMLMGTTQARALARTVVGIGRTIGATTVAEGVETAEQWDALASLDCDRAQGYFFSRPVPATAITDGLIEGSSRLPDPIEAMAGVGPAHADAQ